MLAALRLCAVMIWKNSDMSVMKNFIHKSTEAFTKKILVFSVCLVDGSHRTKWNFFLYH